MFYPHRVTFEAPTPSQLPSGQVVNGYAAVSGLSDLPARIVPVVQGRGETQADRMVVERDMFTVVVKGDIEVDYAMRMESDYLGFPLGVVAFQRPVLYASPATVATIVTAERVTATAQDDS